MLRIFLTLLCLPSTKPPPDQGAGPSPARPPVPGRGWLRAAHALQPRGVWDLAALGSRPRVWFPEARPAEFSAALAGRVPAGSGAAGSMEAGLAVQQESTAAGLDSGGPVRTSWDGDLRVWTVVDVLPLDGMQEVRGSNPRSSTAGQRPFSRTRGGPFAF